ncbi:MBOAT family O-acyltransferase [Dyella silvatica]|uniref:MBOAT family O-acyltransferase n=1 Tax=Dyella silvatica TaxID=2992128 RepID=UPI002256164B|nr:MBOAT family protein [Dyella silvatica]
MLFPTVEFGLFFLLTLGVAWPLARRLAWHNGFLLLVSYVFYGFWNWAYVPLLFGLSLFAALVAQRSQRSTRASVRKAWLVGGVIVCLAVLVYYKYTGFVLQNLLDLWRQVGTPPALQLESPLLPLGISFFVFHAISLLGDVYRQKLKEPVRIPDALLYVAFFPQLIAGPILRASDFIPQLAKSPDPQAIFVNRGLMLIVIGLIKKVIISNQLATALVDPAFAAPQALAGPDMLLAVYGYAVQIYCDFSGYTDIAIGCALLLGYRFPDNFNRPYTATDPQDFWRRWHISLSSWLRDYLYIPLGGSHGGRWFTARNLMITMLLGGLWHGASWTFVIWGGLHGMYLIVHRLWTAVPGLTRLRTSNAWRWIARLLMFHAVCAAWVFFRAPSMQQALDVFARLAVSGPLTLAGSSVVALLLLGLAGQYLPPRWHDALENELSRWSAPLRGAALAVSLFAIELLGPSGVAPFIYFQF